MMKLRTTNLLKQSMSNEGGKIPFSNRLWRARKRHSLGQKQVAYLIEKTVDEVSRYERGIHMPELQTLLALEIIYDTPLRLLFPELHEQIRARIIKRIKSQELLRPKYDALLENSDLEQEYCGYEEILKLSDPSVIKRDKVRRHVTYLAKRLAGL
jgi:transcriptional regulator with XRE-family HTH domain